MVETMGRFVQEADLRYELDRATVARRPLAGLSADEVRDPDGRDACWQTGVDRAERSTSTSPRSGSWPTTGAAELEVGFTTWKDSGLG
jgi:hypothetical protein